MLSASFSLIGILFPIVYVALIYKGNLADYVGWVTIAVSLIVLVFAIPFLGKLAFIPGVLIGVLTYLMAFIVSVRSNSGTAT